MKIFRIITAAVMLLTAMGLRAQTPSQASLQTSLQKTEQTPLQKTERTSIPSFLSLSFLNGSVLPTNEYVMDWGGPKAFSAMTLKYGIYSRGECWEDIAYGMPYGGVGVYSARLYNRYGKVGTPVSLFVFQGGHLARVSRRLCLDYEWNLGMSFGWIPYDPFDNPLNIAIGSSVNVHISVDLYFKWYLNQYLDLNFGVNLTHFSNGDSRLPNAGFNLAAPSIGLVCNFNRNAGSSVYESCPAPPVFLHRIDHDLSLTVSSRQAQFSTVGTGLPSPYIDRKFKVLGLSYAMLFANSYKYKWGPSADMIYDESSGAKAWRQLNPADNMEYDRVKLGSTSSRISVGIGMRGELTMPRYSIFANLGWNAIYGNRNDTRLYQVLGVKLYLRENLFGTFGIRASHFSSAQYLYWSLGYTITGRKKN